jgi:hypothetical protein
VGLGWKESVHVKQMTKLWDHLDQDLRPLSKAMYSKKKKFNVFICESTINEQLLTIYEKADVASKLDQRSVYVYPTHFNKVLARIFLGQSLQHQTCATQTSTLVN